jgi:hypothetical protein
MCNTGTNGGLLKHGNEGLGSIKGEKSQLITYLMCEPRTYGILRNRRVIKQSVASNFTTRMKIKPLHTVK